MTGSVIGDLAWTRAAMPDLASLAAATKAGKVLAAFSAPITSGSDRLDGGAAGAASEPAAMRSAMAGAAPGKAGARSSFNWRDRAYSKPLRREAGPASPAPLSRTPISRLRVTSLPCWLARVKVNWA